jgi:hypothetical protein
MALKQGPRPLSKERGPDNDERDSPHGTAVALLDDPLSEVVYRVQLAREQYGIGYAEGWQAGAVAAIADYKAAQHGIYREARLEQRRRHVCCRRCRLRGHRDGCTGCQERDRETYGEPHPDDFTGRGAA